MHSAPSTAAECCRNCPALNSKASDQNRRQYHSSDGCLVRHQHKSRHQLFLLRQGVNPTGKTEEQITLMFANGLPVDHCESIRMKKRELERLRRKPTRARSSAERGGGGQEPPSGKHPRSTLKDCQDQFIRHERDNQKGRSFPIFFEESMDLGDTLPPVEVNLEPSAELSRSTLHGITQSKLNSECDQSSSRLVNGCGSRARVKMRQLERFAAQKPRTSDSRRRKTFSKPEECQHQDPPNRHTEAHHLTNVKTGDKRAFSGARPGHKQRSSPSSQQRRSSSGLNRHNGNQTSGPRTRTSKTNAKLQNDQPKAPSNSQTEPRQRAPKKVEQKRDRRTSLGTSPPRKQQSCPIPVSHLQRSSSKFSGREGNQGDSRTSITNTNPRNHGRYSLPSSYRQQKSRTENSVHLGNQVYRRDSPSSLDRRAQFISQARNNQNGTKLFSTVSSVPAFDRRGIFKTGPNDSKSVGGWHDRGQSDTKTEFVSWFDSGAFIGWVTAEPTTWAREEKNNQLLANLADKMFKEANKQNFLNFKTNNDWHLRSRFSSSAGQRQR